MAGRFPCVEGCPYQPEISASAPAPLDVLRAVSQFLSRHSTPVTPPVLLMDLLASVVSLLKCSGGAIWEMFPGDAQPMSPRLLLGVRRPTDLETWGSLGLPRMAPAELARLERMLTPVLAGGPGLFVTLDPPNTPHSGLGEPPLEVQHLLALPIERQGYRLGVIALINVEELPEPGWPVVLEPLLTACSTLINWASARPTNPARPGTPLSRQGISPELPAKHASLARMAGGFSHDFNNILTGVMGYSELTLLELPIDSPLVSNVQEILQSSRRAAQLTRQLLLFSGRGQFLTQPLSLNEIILQVIDRLGDRLAPPVYVRQSLQGDLPYIVADFEAIKLVLEHCLINALEGIGRTSGRIEILTESLHRSPESVSWALTPKAPIGPGVMLSIIDNGIGIPPENLEHVFDPYFSTKFAGRGLGLAMVWGILRSHGGGIQIRSTPGHGTQFDLFFPIRPATSAPMNLDQGR